MQKFRFRKPGPRAKRSQSVQSSSTRSRYTTAPRPRKNYFAATPTTLSSQRSLSVESHSHRSTPRPPTAQETNYADEHDEHFDHVVMSLDKLGKDVGCAYYIARTGTLHCFENIPAYDEDVMTSLKTHVQPTVVLVSTRVDLDDERDLSARLSRQGSLNIADNDTPPPPYKVEVRPSSDFNYDQAVNKLACLTTLDTAPDVRLLVPGDAMEADDGVIANEAGMSGERAQSLHLSGLLNTNSRTSIACAGAVVIWLQRKRASEYLRHDPEADEAFAILNVEMTSLKYSMLVNCDTLAALDIIRPESHPTASNQGPGSKGAKESLSIYGLFLHHARTPHGKSRLRNWFTLPSLDLEMIRQRHESVAVLVRGENQSALQALSKSLGRVHNMRRTILTIRKGIEGGSHNAGKIRSGAWSSMLEFCYHIIDISATLCQLLGFERSYLWPKLMEVLRSPDFQTVGKAIYSIVDLEDSQEQHRTVVKRGVNADLDKIKDAYDSMEEMLQQTAIDIAHELPRHLPTPPLNVVYFPQLGFHITVPLHPGTTDAVYDGIEAGWQKMFHTETQAYYKNNKMRDLDEQLGDLYAMICDIEIEISYELAQNVLQYENILIAASDLCGELDCLLALAHGAIEYKLVRPRMVEENIIAIEDGRHLLQQLTVPSYISNDTHLAGSTHPTLPNILLLTGPNYSGKSVYLKQSALIPYMAQVGSFVPCTSATLGVVDKILTRITTPESVSKASSTFMIDLQQMTWALRSFTPRSLLVIDEFGKGTDSADGAGLVAGVLRFLAEQGEEAPKVLMSTHFHEIFEVMDFSPYRNLQFLQMEVRIVSEASRNIPHVRQDKDLMSYEQNSLAYLYNVRPGRSSSSYGTQCAAMNGIPDVIVERAAILNEVAVKGEDLVSICAALSQAEIQELEGAEKVCRHFLELQFEEGGGEDQERGSVRKVLDEICGESETEVVEEGEFGSLSEAGSVVGPLP